MDKCGQSAANTMPSALQGECEEESMCHMQLRRPCGQIIVECEIHRGINAVMRD